MVPAFRHYLAHEQAKPRGFRPLHHGQQPAPTKMHHARMFAFNYGGQCDDKVVEKNGTICDGAVYPGADLTPEQSARAAEIVRRAPDPASWRARPSVQCFEPHHAVVLFDAQDVPVAEVDVCFECGNFTVTSAPDDEGAMTDEEGTFFAETCRAQKVGGCPPPGRYRMPDLPPLPEHAALRSLSIVEQEDHWRREALAQPHGLTEATRLADLSPIDRKVLCAWLVGASRRASSGLECLDGRRMRVDDLAQCARPAPRGCEASVSDFVTCTRARLGTYCSVDPPACAKTDACKRGVVLLP
ncbi:MAG TPA: hypothetical protein VLT33_16145 [Labilithrix sp.]|nr:hypothetical protein [Labilithrix sp.]